MDEPIRIHVYLARLGFGSRREVESWIEGGKVQINGKPAKPGQKIDPATDQIRLKGKNVTRQLSSDEDAVVYTLYKPRGVVSSAKDPQGRPTVVELVPKNPRVFPVGRLDLQSEGLMILTNDGELADRMTHPRYEIPKEYEVKIRGSLDKKKMEYLSKGVRLGNEKLKGAEVLNVIEATESGVPKYIVNLKVYEGKNHHVRKMFETIRCRVIKLKRTAMGPIRLKGLPRGGFKLLSKAQVSRLRKQVGLA